MGRFCERCGEEYTRKDARDFFIYFVANNPYMPFDLTYDDYKNLCGKCAWNAVRAEYDPNYSEDVEDPYEPEDLFSNEYESDEEDNCLPDCDAANIYMSSGEDEDYDFSADGIDSSYYKDED